MALLHIPLGDIDEDDLAQLISTGASESRYIDYKMMTYGARDQDRAEFLADISSFANTVGGDLVLGINADHGVPIGLTPLNVDVDTERLRLEQMARAGLEPRISNLQIRDVPLRQGGVVMVVRATRSFSLPHRVIYGGRNRFWVRSSAGKYEPNVEELRTLFNEGPQLIERIRAFRVERAAKIRDGWTPLTMPTAPLVMLHLVPFSAFDVGRGLDVRELQQNLLQYPPLGWQSPSVWRPNLDGFLTASPSVNGVHHAYTQVFRSGIVESLTTEERGQGDGILTAAVDVLIVQGARSLLAGLHARGVEPPVAAMTTLVRARGHSIQAEADLVALPIDEDPLYLTEVVFETAPNDNNETAQALRPIMDQLANVAGQVSTRSIDAQGNFRARVFL